MNKAFVKDDDTWEDPEIELDPEADIPAGSRNYMTPQGAARLREELHDLTHRQRPLLVDTINRMGRDKLIRRAAAFIYLEFEQLRHIFEDRFPRKIADIGCGYAIFDLFLAQEFDSTLNLIDLESNESRHFGFKEGGSAYSNLGNASRFLQANGVMKSAINTLNPPLTSS